MQSKTSTKGRLTNLDAGGTLTFSLNPTEVKISRQYDYSVDSLLGQASSLVSFKSGQPATLTFSVRFDQDADSSFKADDVTKFLKTLNTIKEDTRQAPLLEFVLGNLKFKGFASSYNYSANRFDADGNTVGLSLDMALLSNGEDKDA